MRQRLTYDNGQIFQPLKTLYNNQSDRVRTPDDVYQLMRSAKWIVVIDMRPTNSFPSAFEEQVNGAVGPRVEIFAFLDILADNWAFEPA